MADDKLRELVTNAENNILRLFSDNNEMRNYFEVLHRNPDLTYYAASMVNGAAVYVDTYEGWKERGYQVKAGEHGAAVFHKRKQLKRKFIDDNGRVRDLSSASFIEKQRIQSGDLKLSSDLSSYYTIEYLFSQNQTTAEDVNLDINIPESSLSFENVKSVIEESTNDILDGDDFVLPNSILQCTNAYATYLLCLNDNVPGDRDELFQKSTEDILNIKDSLSLSDKKLILNSVIKVIRSEHTLELLKNMKENIAEAKENNDIEPVDVQENHFENNYIEEVLSTGKQEDISSFGLNFDSEAKAELKNNKIEDFGKKIGGARKDIWAERGLSVDDLSDMNLAEKYKYATKNNVFKKPDFQEMVDNGLPVRVAYFIKTVRDALPPKPVFTVNESNDDLLAEEKIKGYVEFICGFKEALLNIHTDEDILSFYDDVIKDVYVKNISTYSIVPTEKSHGCLTNKLLKACQVSRYGLIDFDRKIKKKQFCYSEHDKKIDGFEIAKYDDSCEFEKDRERTVLKKKVINGSYFYYPKDEFADASKWIKDTYYVLYKSSIVANNLSMEQAKETVERMADLKAATVEATEPEKKKRKSKFVPKQLEHIERTGPSFGIDENNLADGDMYLNTFGFAGGEFGNWMSEKDRQASLNFGYDALMDLADALEIEPEDISLGGELSIAFGSRGRAGAFAHYEPLYQVINLTKMKGAGSLAHEWGHALDNILSRKFNSSGIDTWLTDCNKDGLSSVEELMHTIKYRQPTDEERRKAWKKDCDYYENYLYSGLSHGMDEHYGKKVLDNFKDEISALLHDGDYDEVKTKELIFKMSRNYKDLTGRELHRSVKESFMEDVAAFKKQYNKPLSEVRCSKRRTDFFSNSIKFDSLFSKEARGYWQSNKELFARAFACYVMDKLPYKSDYLCGHANSARSSLNGETIRAYPVGAEREAINKCFDKMIAELKKVGLLHQQELVPVRSKSR